MRVVLIAVAVAALFTGTGALAQQSTTPGQQMPMMSQGMMDYGMMYHRMMPMMDPSQHIEGRLAFLKTELKITEAQTPQWTAYADALRANATRMGQLMTEMMSSGMMNNGMMNNGMMMGNQGMMMQGQSGAVMSLPDRLNWAEQHMAAHMEMLQAIKGPTEQLYSVLSAEQKRIADQIMGPMGMMGMM